MRLWKAVGILEDRAGFLNERVKTAEAAGRDLSYDRAEASAINRVLDELEREEA
jgi:hypothetical protein